LSRDPKETGGAEHELHPCMLTRWVCYLMKQGLDENPLSEHP